MSSILNLKKDGNWITIPSLEGAQGEQGPNLITPETATTLTGLIKGNGSTVEAATPGADYLEYDDIAGRSDSGSNPVLEGVFPGTELAHCILHGKSTQDGTPSPSAPVDIVDYEPGEVAVTGANIFRGLGVPNDEAGHWYETLNSTPTSDGFRRFYLDNSGGAATAYANAFSRLSAQPPLRPDTIYKAMIEFRNVKSLGPTGAGIVFSLNAFPGFPESLAFENGINLRSEDVSNGTKIITTIKTTADLSIPTLYLRTYSPVGAGGVTDFECRISVYPADYDVTEYTPYQGTTYPLSDLTLPGIPVDSGGNYTDESGQQYIADTYDVATGEYVQRVPELVLDGTEAWITQASPSDYRFVLRRKDIKPAVASDIPGTLICTHYETLSTAALYQKQTGIGVGVYDTAINTASLAVYDANYPDKDVSLWKAHLAELYAAGTPVTIRYALAEPIVSYRTPQQLPAPAPYTQVMAGGGHIAATLGNAMSPIKTTPQTLTVEQLKQVYINLNIPVPTYEYSDRDLSKVFSADELHEKIAAQDFSGIRMGDYWPIPLSGTAHDYATDTDFTLNERHLLEFMPNFYAESGDTVTPPHILVCSRDLLSKTLQFRGTDDVWYDTAATNPWLGSHLYQTLNNPDNGIVNLVRQTDIGQYLYAGPNGKGMRDVLETKAAGATTATARGWADRGLMFLPHEREVWGNGPFSEKQDGGYCLQWATFAGSRNRIVKHRNGSRCGWWSCSSVAGSSAHICFVNIGDTSTTSASRAGLSVPLCFLIT